MSSASIVLLTNFGANNNAMRELRMRLNKTQIEILKLFTQPLSDEDLKEIKTLLVKHLAERLVRKTDVVSRKKGYAQHDFDNWLNEPGQ